MRCRKGFDIDMGYITGELPKQTERITKERNCPYRQEKRPKYKRHNNEKIPLFEGIA